MPFDAARVPWRVSASETGDIASSPPESVVEDRSTSAGQLQSLRDPSPEIVASACPSAEKAIAKMASPACALGKVGRVEGHPSAPRDVEHRNRPPCRSVPHLERLGLVPRRN